MTLTIEYLSSDPALVGTVGEMQYDAFKDHNLTATRESVLADLQPRVGSREVPLCLVAFQDGVPVGTVSIIGDDMPTRPEFKPWLADLVVAPAHRRQGLGTALFRRAEAEFQRLGLPIAYLFTWDHEPLYTRLGWTTILRETYRQDFVAVMKREF
jgi:predicted N-acetyltransferase YhbS